MARKKKPQEAAQGAPAWMATFGDLMNLLLCFFVLLFSLSSVDSTKYEELVTSFSNRFSVLSGGEKSIGEGKLISSGATQLNNLDKYISDMGKAVENDSTEEMDPLNELREQQEKLTQEMYEDISQIIEKNNMEDYVALSSNSPYVKLSLDGAILFDSGKAEIKKGALPILNKVGDILKIYNKYKIEIEGHTDNIPISNNQYRNNLRLSTDRACYVLEYLLLEKGLDPRTLSSSGRAEYEPIASNSTAEGRAKNRRVEIKIYNSLSNK